jgi:CheY-like chemotaxis protein
MPSPVSTMVAACWLLHYHSPLCIILDVYIPGKSGLDVLKELATQHHPAPVFIISGQGDIPMAVEAITNGALDFIEKPFRGTEVVARKLLRRSEPEVKIIAISGYAFVKTSSRRPISFECRSNWVLPAICANPSAPASWWRRSKNIAYLFHGVDECLTGVRYGSSCAAGYQDEEQEPLATAMPVLGRLLF